MNFNENYNIFSVYQTSLNYYKTGKVDDKKRRAKLDIVSARITLKNNFVYNRSLKVWEQNGKSSKITFLVSSQPISYKKSDTINTHKFPVIVQMKDISLGVFTPFRWRTGSQFKWIKKIPTMTSIQIANLNILHQIQAQFMFNLEYVLKLKGLLYGVCRASKPPRITNPKLLVYFDKHMFYCVKEILFPLLNNKEMITKIVNQSKK